MGKNDAKKNRTGDFVIDEECGSGEEMDEVIADWSSAKGRTTPPSTFKKRDRVEKMVREQLAKSISDYDVLIDDAGREMKEMERSIKKAVKAGHFDVVDDLLKSKASLRSSLRMLMTSKERVLLELVKQFDLMGSLERKTGEESDSTFNLVIDPTFSQKLDIGIIDPKPEESDEDV